MLRDKNVSQFAVSCCIRYFTVHKNTFVITETEELWLGVMAIDMRKSVVLLFRHLSTGRHGDITPVVTVGAIGLPGSVGLTAHGDGTWIWRSGKATARRMLRSWPAQLIWPLILFLVPKPRRLRAGAAAKTANISMRSAGIRPVSDRRGVAALEFAIIATVMIGLLLPLSDLAIAAIRYVGAYQSLRDLGAYAQYHAPPDVTDLTAWTLPTITGYTINTTVMCGPSDPPLACSTTNFGSPQWFVFSTNVTLTPMVLTALAGTYTVVYSEQFQ